MSATDSAPVKDRKSTLLDMPLVIVRIILEEVFLPHRIRHPPINVCSQLHQYNPNSLLNFRLVSKTCQRESEFLLFQNLIIHDKTSIAKDINPIILDRLQNTEDALAERVRHLQFGPFVDGKYFLTVVSPVLAKTIRNLGDLQSLRYTLSNLRLLRSSYPPAGTIICRFLWMLLKLSMRPAPPPS